MARSQEEYLALLQNPNVRGGLAAIRLGEGTSGADGYRTMFGGGKFNDLSRHPRQINRGGGYASDAAGAYQFLSTTWDGAAKNLGLKDMSQRNQDIAALYLIDQRGALDELAGKGFTPGVSNKLAPEWASLPTLKGNSYYGQPVKSFGVLAKAAQAGGAQPAGPTTTGTTGKGTTGAGSGGLSDGLFPRPDAQPPIPVPGIDLPQIKEDPAMAALENTLLQKLIATDSRMAGSTSFAEALTRRIAAL